MPSNHALCCALALLAGASASADPTDVVRGLLQRRLPATHVDLFELAIAPPTTGDGPNEYTLSPSTTIPGGVRVAGDSPVSVAAGVGYYLAHIANASISWTATGGDNIAAALPPTSLPQLPGNASITRSAGGNTWRYYFNVCTCVIWRCSPALPFGLVAACAFIRRRTCPPPLPVPAAVPVLLRLRQLPCLVSYSDLSPGLRATTTTTTTTPPPPPQHRANHQPAATDTA